MTPIIYTMSKQFFQNELRVLTAARQRIAQPNGWTQDSFARNAEGDKVSDHHPSATCFCAWGAVRRARTDVYLEEHFGTTDTLFSVLGLQPGDSVASWNDNPKRTQAEVIAAFDKAITHVRARLAEFAT